MNPRTLATKAAKLGVNWPAVKLAFFLGCIVGMVVEAVLITVPKALMALTGVLP